ncbi:phospholipase D regulator [Sporobolomyces salmoneus]|uniref:phospholipase D regulator n=1 Tax=Sporobolomyces salmoneus TaxID=183962 RepID=UPI00316E9E12
MSSSSTGDYDTTWQYPGGSRKVVTVPSWARNLPPDELSDEGHEYAATDPSPRRPNNPPRRSLSSVFQQNRSAPFSNSNNIPLNNTNANATGRSPNLTASTSSSPIPPFSDPLQSPEPTHNNPASTTIHRNPSSATAALGGDKGWWTFTLPSKYLDRVHGYIHPKEWNEKGKERADHQHQQYPDEEDETRSMTSQRSMRSGWSMRSGRRPSKSREQDRQDYHRKMTQSMKINLGPPNIFSINQATTPGWASPWQPFERSEDDRRMQDPFDISQQQTAAVEASRKSRFENFILHNPFSPLFFRIINLVLVTCTLALAGHIRRQEERADVVGVIGTSTLFVLVIAPIAIIHIFITLYIEYFGAPIGLWQIRTKMFYTLTDLVLICLYSSALSLSLDDLFTSSLECTAYTPYRRYNSPSPTVVGTAGLEGSIADQICSQQIAQVVFIFLSVFVYLAVLIISLFRIFAKVSRK